MNPVATLFFITVSILAAETAHDYNREIARQRKELDETRDQLESEQRELKALKAKKTITLEELERLQGNIALTGQYLAKLENMEMKLIASVEETRRDSLRLHRRLKKRSAVMSNRVRLLFMAGRPENLIYDSPFSTARLAPGQSREGGTFFHRAYLVKRIVRADHRLAEDSRRDLAEKRKSLIKLSARRQELEIFQSRKRDEADRFTRQKSEQEQSLRALQHSESMKAAALKQLEENARLLNKIIAVLEKKRKEEQARRVRKALVLDRSGRYCQPVEGTVVSSYGLQYHATLGTTTRNLGIEIQSTGGAPVRAAVAGEVALITPIPGYGLGIILDNGSGYFTLYANLAGIRVNLGDKVASCQEIANVAARPGRVYFEVRQGTKTLDPVAWLRGTLK